MRKKPTRILLLEDNLADAGFLREALAELEETHIGNSWVSPYELCDAESLAEALLLLEEISFDVILADLWTSDSAGLTTLQRLKAASPQTPIIVLTQVEDPGLTVRLVQEGAQEVLVKSEVDCMPLGKSIRCAVERNRIAHGLRRLNVRDEMTGLLNFTGFLQLGEPFCRLLRHVPRTSACACFNISNLDAVSSVLGRHEEEWLIVETAELLKSLTRDTDLSGYFGNGRFAMLSPERNAATLLSALAGLTHLLKGKALARGAFEIQVQCSAADLGEENAWNLDRILDQTEEALWENKPFENACKNEITSLIQ